MGSTKRVTQTLLLLHLAALTFAYSSKCVTSCEMEEIHKNIIQLNMDFLTKVRQQLTFTGMTPCRKEEMKDITTELDMDFIKRVKEKVLLEKRSKCEMAAKDCADSFLCGNENSGVYTIRPKYGNTEGKVEVYCDMDTDGGGWTVIQRRGRGYGRTSEYFNKNWEEYKNGFGDIRIDFWLGNDKVFALSNQKEYSIRFDLGFESESAFAQYSIFRIENETGLYRLHVNGYSKGNAGDAMTNHHDGQPFSTKDKDNDPDEWHCAERFKSGWWFGTGCFSGNLNGIYIDGTDAMDALGIIWAKWKSFKKTLKSSEMKIRPKNFDEH